VPDGGTGVVDGGPEADSGTSDRCDVAKLDPAHMPATRALSGSLGTHDPTVIESKGVYYLWNTGPRLPAKTSTDLTRWTDAPSAFGSRNPAWVADEVPEATDLWAPDVSFFGGQFHLYYSASTFGTNSSCIGHATRPALDTGSWADQGPVVCSNHGTRDDWNAIDPNVVVDVDGKAWLSFGSFWSGIKAIELDASGARANDKLHALATRSRDVGGAIEAPIIVRRCGYYYLFVSFDRCCAGNDSTYNIRVGRSQQVMGPYVDAEGKAMMQGGGTLIVGGDSRYHGPGHNAVLFSGDRAWNIYHTYDGQQNGRAILRVSELWWNDAGWPLSGGP
jgi:arabinan endo-1,5-alpha-L-arabinosidase